MSDTSQKFDVLTPDRQDGGSNLGRFLMPAATLAAALFVAGAAALDQAGQPDCTLFNPPIPMTSYGNSGIWELWSGSGFTEEDLVRWGEAYVASAVLGNPNGEPELLVMKGTQLSTATEPIQAKPTPRVVATCGTLNDAARFVDQSGMTAAERFFNNVDAAIFGLRR